MRSLESLEIRILTELQKNGRLTNQDLADLVGLSPSACWRRVRSLEEEGVIKNYQARVSGAKVGFPETIFARVSLEKHSDNLVQNFETAINNQPEVVECFATSGDSDYLLRVVASDISSYDDFIQKFLLKIEGVSQVRSNFQLREVKGLSPYPI
ncbi:MAG: Lrp/AsnC family transcriptional regulator [OCS116 cluster bacterium]|uniref:AsnC family transcriptional regulator n=1 Tax=OCS116 cluster bacterium TaxID=2030921 RepID=A0A2A4YVU8_9PROT|nr:Lrp/AsnC family transcriptional regulator [OCS116 cluster bacterium]